MATLARKIYPIEFSHLVAFDKRLFETYCFQVKNNQLIQLTGTKLGTKLLEKLNLIDLNLSKFIKIVIIF